MQTNANEVEDVERPTENRNDYSASGRENGTRKRLILYAIDFFLTSFRFEFVCATVFYVGAMRANGQIPLYIDIFR